MPVLFAPTRLSGKQGLQGADLGRDGSGRTANQLVVGVHPNPWMCRHLEAPELEHLATIFVVLAEQRRGERAADDVVARSACVYGKLEVRLDRRGVADGQLASNRRGVGKDEGHGGAGAFEVAFQLVPEALSSDDVLQLLRDLAELQFFSRIAKDDRLPEKANRTRLEKDVAVYPPQRD